MDVLPVPVKLFPPVWEGVDNSILIFVQGRLVRLKEEM
jgi:hypothetical protein